MRCRYCGEENIVNAWYCRRCGRAFSDRERARAYERTLPGRLERLGRARPVRAIGRVSADPFFRALVLLSVLGLGLYFLWTGGRFAVLKGEGYSVAYNAEMDEYYVATDLPKVSVRLREPGDLLAVTVTGLDFSGAPISTETLAPGEEIVLVRTPYARYDLLLEREKSTEHITVFLLTRAQLAAA